MSSRRVSHILVVGITLAFSCLALWGAKEFVAPRAENANTYPLKDAHPNEKVTAAIELYNAAPKDQIFVTPYNQEGLLPVFLVISNDGDQPVALTSMRSELVTAGHTKLESLTSDDVFRRVAHISGDTNAPPRLGPIPLSGNKNKKAQKQYEEIQNARFAAEAVEPHTTKSGFLFFDVAGVRQPVDGAEIYLTGINDAGGNELMYFEIPVTPSKAQ
jgi:hypothetical protein